MQIAAALEVMRLIHLEVPVFGFVLEGLFLAEVVVEFSLWGDGVEVQMALWKRNEGKFLRVSSN